MTPELLKVSGVIPLSQTIFLWQNGVAILVMTLVSVFVGYATAPRGKAVRTAAHLGINTGTLFEDAKSINSQEASRPGDFLANSPALVIIVGAAMAAWVISTVMQVGLSSTISNLNNYLFISLTVAFILHWRVASFLKAMNDAVPAVGGILLQFPIYAAVAAVLMLAQNSEGHSVAHYLGQFFAKTVTTNLMPPVVGIYSIVVGFFIPSAGAKWVVEAPYILDAGNRLHSHLGWLVNTYGGAETLANLINPFWMLPMLGLMKMRVRSVVGFTFMYFVFLTPIMLTVFWLLGLTLQYRPPVML
jgi:short-chain fatty acids transporter